MGKLLKFVPERLTQLAKELSPNAEAEVVDLHSRLKKIYARVNLNYGTGSRMIFDAILLALAEIVSNEQYGVAILPEMRIDKGGGEGVLITNPVSGYELWVSGNVDYVAIEYEDVSYNKDCLLDSNGLSYLHLARGHLFLVKEKHQDQVLSFSIPEAVSQAIALLKSAKLPEVRFCLSNGEIWMFFVLKMDLKDETLTYFESPPLRLSKTELFRSDLELRKIVQLICEWLKPTLTDMFEFE